MGRHSAPDDEDQDLDVSGTLTAVRAEESPGGTTPPSGGRHSRTDGQAETEEHTKADVDALTDVSATDASAPTQLFRPYTGDFGAGGASGTDGVTELAEAHTSELPVVTDEAPSAALINGAPTLAHPGTDTADLGAPIDVPLIQDEPAAAVRPAAPDTTETAGAGDATGGGPTSTPETAAAPDSEVAPETVSEKAPETVSDAVPETGTTDRPATGTRADLALLRTHPGLRARAAAAVLTPFVLYAIVLAVLGRFDQALLWVWIPIILAGVAFGLVLDLAQRARDRQRNDTPDSSAP